MPAIISEGNKMKTVKRFMKQQAAERKRKMWLAEKLEAMTDETFLDRILEDEPIVFSDSEEEVVDEQNIPATA